MSTREDRFLQHAVSSCSFLSMKSEENEKRDMGSPDHCRSSKSKLGRCGTRPRCVSYVWVDWSVAGKKGDIEKASGSIGFRGTGNSGPVANFDQLKSKIRDRTKNKHNVTATKGGEHRRKPFSPETISMAVSVWGLDHRAGWCSF